MNRVIFVGIHNKPNLKPLDSSTKTGRLIDSVINRMPSSISCVKSNLFNMDRMPTDSEMEKDFVFLWKQRVNYNEDNDIVVCLGKLVSSILKMKVQVIESKHPASFWSQTHQKDYEVELVKEIMSSIAV